MRETNAIEQRLRTVEADWRELARQNNELIELHRGAEKRAEGLARVLEAVLLFHAAGEWNEARRARWAELTGGREATTRGLCDAVREVLG